MHRPTHRPTWLSMTFFVLVLLLATTALADAQSPDVHLPLVTGGEQIEGEPQTGADEQPAPVVEDAEDFSDPDDELIEGEADEAVASIAAFNSTNWYVSNRMGVGTDAPAHRLSVIGGPAWTRSGWVGSLELGNGGAIAWRTNSAGQRFGMGHSTNGFYLFRTGSNPGTVGQYPTYDLFINNSGRVGLGTTSPAHHLSINGGPAWTSNNWSGAVDLTNSSAIGWRANSGGHSFGMGHTNDGFHLFRTASKPGTTGSAAEYDLTINNSGHVGIGATTPVHRLSIAAGPAWPQTNWYGAIDLPNASAIGWHRNNHGYSFGMGQSGGGFVLFRTTSAPGTISGETNYEIYISNEGQIGIGTSSLSAKLNVNGSTRIYDGDLMLQSGDFTITGGSIYVDGQQMEVPDYVFEPDYPLLSLDELRAYIAEEKHLPNVPSEDEIRAGTLDLTDFQMKLLEKTEELTLYTLAQDEQIEQLQQENQLKDEQLADMQQMLADLEARLAALEAQQ